MSTHAITLYVSREWDGETSREVGHFWRKFDGHPTAHGAALKRAVGEKQFQTLWELVGAVSSGLRVNVRGMSYNWMFVPVDPHTINDAGAEFAYYLALVDQNGEMPRGGQCTGKCSVALIVKQHGRTLYAGLLKDYVPRDPTESPEETPRESYEELRSSQ